MRNKKITLWTIIILLIIFLPLTIYATTMHIILANQKEENYNHEFKYNGNLYFYDENGNLLGKYTCASSMDNCDYALVSSKKDNSLNELESEEASIPVIANRFVFLKDGVEDSDKANILLYDLNLNRTIGKYQEVKDYGIGIDRDYYILKNEDDLWGVVSFEDGIVVNLPFQYDYIGLAGHVNSESNKVESNIFAVYNNKNWQLMDASGASFVEDIADNLIDYDNEYIIVERNNMVQVLNYYNQTLLENYKEVRFYKQYLMLLDINNQFCLYNINGMSAISKSYSINSLDDVEIVTEDNTIKISRNGKVEETIEI